MKTSSDVLPPIIAGPILRHVDEAQVVIWLVTTQPSTLSAALFDPHETLVEMSCNTDHEGCIQLGEKAWLHLITLRPPGGVPEGVWLHYDIGLPAEDAHRAPVQWLHDIMPDLCFAEETRPRFVRKSHLDTVLHGSCRKPHYQGEDGFIAAESVLAAARPVRHTGADKTAETAHQGAPDGAEETSGQPTLLMLHGDQVYIDDVAGPMLLAIRAVINLLGLPDEAIAGSARVALGSELLDNHSHIYERLSLLPDDPANTTLIQTVFQGARKPIFTSVHADNHLITLSEVLAMYLLVWSPELWTQISWSTPPDLTDKQLKRYQEESTALETFVSALPAVRRALANVPVYMIFDDHDVTDDWNLTKDWEDRAYGHPFSRRIIGNAMIGYLLCQGWGNDPSTFSTDLIQQVRRSLEEDEPQAHDRLITRLLEFSQWGYMLNTEPRVVVLDSRTRRWPSSFSSIMPSGLLNEQGLQTLKSQLLGQQSVLLVSPAPIFGVKLIEVIQRIFTWFGQALVVDAENWMSHKGAAKGILEIFQHPETPETFVILSGDVHYSFAYDVRLRRNWRQSLHLDQPPGEPHASPHIWQITSSGIKNCFPVSLLRMFDRANRWLYAGYSPLNLLTRRRRMHIRSRRPTPHKKRYRHQRLVNASSIGVLNMDREGQPCHIAIRTSEGEDIAFQDGYPTDWH